MSRADLRVVHSAGNLRTQHGSGSGGDGLEARLAKLESDVGHIQTDIGTIKTDLIEIRKESREDFRVTWVGIITVGLGLAALMAKGFHWL